MAGTSPQDSITGTQYRVFEQAYQWLSTYVFVDVLGHPLPPCLITLQRRQLKLRGTSVRCAGVRPASLMRRY